jgi:hypothetical protein
MAFENVSAAAATEQPPPIAQNLEQKRLDIEERRLALEKTKLEQEKEKETRNFKLESRNARVTALAVAGPLALGVITYMFQIYTQRRNESQQFKLQQRNEALQFKLKAAEIAMAARDSSHVAQKAAILKALFGEDLKGFDPGEFDPKKFPLRGSVDRRESLIELLAQHPNSRQEIIRAWALLYPGDARGDWGKLPDEQKSAYRWFEELQRDDTLNRNKPSDPSNESLQFKLKAAEIAMAARDSSQVAQKAAILKALFPEELKGFDPGEFDPKKFPFSESVERRERLIELLAQHPNSRQEIIRAWALLYPWEARGDWGKLPDEQKSAYRWFEELQRDDTLNRNKPSDPNNNP